MGKIEYWAERFDNKSHKDNLQRLGNLTLTTATENSKLSNRAFDEKKEIYKESVWQLNKEISNYPVWTPDYIDKREEILIKYTKTRWGFNNIFDSKQQTILN